MRPPKETSMSASSPVESAFDVESFIHEYYDAWSGTDLDRIMSYYADDVVLQIPGLLMEGNEAVRNQFARPFTTAFPGNRHFVKKMILGPGVVTVEFSFEAEHKGPFAGHAATGARISLPGCGVYEYDSATRQITSGRIYFDVGTLLQTITDALVDDRQKSEEALRTNERNLSLITNVIPTFIHVLRTDGSVLYVNQAVLGYTGLTLEDVRKEDYRTRVFHPDDVERLREERAEALLRPVPFENEQRVLGKDGKYRWFLIRYNPLLDEQGRIARWYVAAFDIEDRKRAEDAQARQAGVRADVSAAFSKPTHLGEILRGCTEAIVRHLDAAFARIWMLNKDESMLELQASAGMYTRLDGSYSRIPVGDLKVGWIGREKKAHLTNDVMNDPRVHDKAWARHNGMVAFAGHPLVVEDRLIGVVALFARSTLSESILDTLASIADMIAQGIERKRAEEALKDALDQIQKSESNLRQVIDTIPALTWCNLPDGPNEFLSKGWHEYTGLSEEQSHGWGWQAAFHPEDLPPLMERWMKVLTSGKSDEIEARLRRHDGVYRWFLIRAEPFRDEAGKIARWYGTSTDIDDRKKAEDAQAHQARVRADVSAAFANPTQLREILRGCTEAIVRHLDAAFARIWMLNKDESMLELQASAGMYTRLDGSYSRIPVGDLKVGLIAREKKAHFTNDVVNDPRVNDKRWAEDNGMVAFAGYPLLVEDRLIGVLALFARRQLSESVLDTLASVADTIAQGTERRRAEAALQASE